MSDWPPAELDTDYVNATPTPNTHPNAHVQVNEAVNTTVATLGTPQGGYLTAGQNIDAVRQGDADYQNRGLYGWRRAVANRRTTRAVLIAGPGDSRTEGSGLDTIEDRWLNLLAQELDRRYPTPGSRFTQGYIPSWYGTNGLAEEPTSAGTYTDSTGAGLGARCTVLRTGTPVGQKTWTVQGDNAWFYYARINNGGKSEYRIDGGSWVEVDHNNGAPGFAFEEHRIQVALGDVDTHTVDWRFKSAGSGVQPNPVIEGIEAVEGDPTIGITVIDCGHSGFATGGYTSSATLLPQWVDLQGDGCAAIAMDLSVNNWQVSDPDNIAADVAAYRAAMVTILDALQDGNSLLEVVLLGGWTPIATLSTGEPDQYPLFVAAQYDLTAQVPYTTVYDFMRFLPQPDQPGDTPAPAGGFYDTFAIHPQEQGHAAIGSALADHYSLPTGGAWGTLNQFDTWDLTDSFVDFGTGTPIDLGTGGEAYMMYRTDGVTCDGWVFMNVAADASYGGAGLIGVYPESLPVQPATLPAGLAWTGEFGAVDGAGFDAFTAVPSVSLTGGGMTMVFYLGVPTAGPAGSVWSSTNPETLTGETYLMSGGFRYITTPLPSGS